MKTLMLGDTHGRDIWKRIVDFEEPDKVIFIGDYFDTFEVVKYPWDKQIANFKDIMEFKKTSGKEVITLIGNHDYHYLKTPDYGMYSGFQKRYAPHITQVIEEHLKELQIAHIHKGTFLCTHAGVTKTFCQMQNIDTTDIENSLNDRFKYKPNSFGFMGVDSYGDDVTQGPLWVRHGSLISDFVEEYIHVIGHTQTLNVQMKAGGSIIAIDCLEYGKYFLEDGNLNFKTFEDVL